LENEDVLDLTCPVCNLPVPSNDYTQHIEHCLINADAVSRDFSDQEDEEVDMTEGVVETYTWAGHTRVRATSLVEGGLRGPGFVEITNSSEDQILDIGAKYLVFSPLVSSKRAKNIPINFAQFV
jgi:hypothetical protein